MLIKVIFVKFGLLTFFSNSFSSHFRAFLLDYFDKYRTVNSSSQYWCEVKKKDEELLILPHFSEEKKTRPKGEDFTRFSEENTRLKDEDLTRFSEENTQRIKSAEYFWFSI